MGVATGGRIKGALGVLAAAMLAAVLAALLAAAPVRAARAGASTPTPRHANQSAQAHHLGRPATPHPTRVLTPKFFDKHAVDAYIPATATLGQPIIREPAAQFASSPPTSFSAEVCSRGPPAGELVP